MCASSPRSTGALSMHSDNEEAGSQAEDPPSNQQNDGEHIQDDGTHNGTHNKHEEKKNIRIVCNSIVEKIIILEVKTAITKRIWPILEPILRDSPFNMGQMILEETVSALMNRRVFRAHVSALVQLASKDLEVITTLKLDDDAENKAIGDEQLGKLVMNLKNSGEALYDRDIRWVF